MPLPSLGPTDVLIQVKAVTICGSDLHIFKGKHPAVQLPIPVGHEIAGQIVEIGGAVTGVAVGDRVAVEPVLVCDACLFCARGDYHLCSNISFQYRRGQGGFTPWFIADQRWVHRLPDHASWLDGALLEPLAVCVHAVRRANVAFGDQAAIFGDGAIGLFTLQAAQLAGMHLGLPGRPARNHAWPRRWNWAPQAWWTAGVQTRWPSSASRPAA